MKATNKPKRAIYRPNKIINLSRIKANPVKKRKNQKVETKKLRFFSLENVTCFSNSFDALEIDSTKILWQSGKSKG